MAYEVTTAISSAWSSCRRVLADTGFSVINALAVAIQGETWGFIVVNRCEREVAGSLFTLISFVHSDRVVSCYEAGSGVVRQLWR